MLKTCFSRRVLKRKMYMFILDTVAEKIKTKTRTREKQTAQAIV